MSVPKSRQNISKFVRLAGLADVPGLYHFGPFRLSENERLLFCGESEVRLKSKDLDVLLVLVKNRPRLVTKAELMEEVWPDSYVGEANLGVHIACLRRALRKHAPRYTYIETVPKYGYRFVELESGESEPMSNEAERRNGQFLVNYVRESLRVCTQAVLELPGGIRIEARKSEYGTEVTMTIPKNAEGAAAERSELALRHWSVQRDGVMITTTRPGDNSCVRIFFKNS